MFFKDVEVPKITRLLKFSVIFKISSGKCLIFISKHNIYSTLFKKIAFFFYWIPIFLGIAR